MRVRCEAFRARCESGMRDAEAAHIPVPEHFSQASTHALHLECLNAPCPRSVQATVLTYPALFTHVTKSGIIESLFKSRQTHQTGQN